VKISAFLNVYNLPKQFLICVFLLCEELTRSPDGQSGKTRMDHLEREGLADCHIGLLSLQSVSEFIGFPDYLSSS